MRGDPDRQPVVAEIYHGIGVGSRREGQLQQPRQQPSAWNLHRRSALQVLPAGLILPFSGQQLNALTSGRKHRTRCRHKPQPMAPFHESAQQ